MMSRELPREEWHRLHGTDLGSALDARGDGLARVAVVEDDAGTIVACWGLFAMVHAEGAWIAPEYRRRSLVTVRLWREMRRLVQEWGASQFITGAGSPEVAELLRAHGEELPQEYLVCL